MPARAALLAIAAVAISTAVGCTCGGDDEAGDFVLRRSVDAAPVEYIAGRVSIDKVAVKAAEVEPNNAAGKATAVELPGGATGVLSSSNDVDFYRVEVKRPGELTVAVETPDGIDTIVELYDEGDTKKPIAVSDRGGKGTDEGVPNFPVGRDQVVLVSVREFVKKPRRKKRRGKKAAPAKTKPAREGDSEKYTVRVGYAPKAKPGYEREPNGTDDAPASVLLGDKLRGYIGWTDDVDTFKFPLDGFTGEATLDVTIDGVDGVTMSLELRGPKGKKLLSRRGTKGSGVWVRNFVPPDGSHVSAVLKAKRSNPVQTYSLVTATSEVVEGGEREPNERGKTATPLRDGEQTSGEITGVLDPGDVDFFVLKPGSAGALDITVTPASGVDAKLGVWTGGSEIASSAGGGSGDDERLRALSVAAGKNYYIKVSAKSAGYRPEPYTLRWSLGGAVPSDDDDTSDEHELE